MKEGREEEWEVCVYVTVCGLVGGWSVRWVREGAERAEGGCSDNTRVALIPKGKKGGILRRG